MAANVSPQRAVEVFGHEKDRGTYPREIKDALTALGVAHAGRFRRVSPTKPVYPPRAILYAHRHGRPKQAHWLLIWDGKIFDPEGVWPDGYRNWHITSYLEIY
jgi:hypothetical protein